MKIKLSKRLAAVAGMIPPGSDAADIGTDHGYLPVYLVMNKICPRVVATDAAPQPLAAAKNLVDLLSLGRKVDLRLGDGLQVLTPGEVDTICLAGMGASTMEKILDRSPEVLEKIRRVIVQPMRGAPRIRMWLAGHGWAIIDEELVYEEGNFYEVIAAEPGKRELSPDEAEIGPVFLANKPLLLKNYLSERIKALEKIDHSLERGCSPETGVRQEKIRNQIRQLKRVITCL